VEDTLMNNPVVIVLVIALVVAIGAAVWLFMRNRRSEQLQQRFGPEYERALETHHDQRKAERELEERADRVEHLNIRPLERDERERFSSRWQSVQAQFVDDPSGATDEADQLVGEVMATRGYPVGDFEQRAADVSVHHPMVVEHYRAAHTIAVRNARGDSDTEQLRQALMHYRALFDDLLETESTARTEVRR
jgi:ABC-type nickel/cobalt efflux system permease component RcnA